MSAVVDYRAVKEALKQLQFSVATEYPPDRFSHIQELMKEIQKDLNEVGLLIKAN